MMASQKTFFMLCSCCDDRVLLVVVSCGLLLIVSMSQAACSPVNFQTIRVKSEVFGLSLTIVLYVKC